MDMDRDLLLPPIIRVNGGLFSIFSSLIGNNLTENNNNQGVSEEFKNNLRENTADEEFISKEKQCSICLEDFKLNDKQGIQRDCDLHNKTHINKEEIKRFIEKLEYPLYYLDFETFSSAIPSLNGTRPYQQIPFQFSLHIDNGKSIKHIEFLAEDLDDRKKLLQKLIDNLGTEGSILVYFKSFEINRLKELAKAFPENKEWVENILKRVVDLIEPFQNFHYYNPKQKGSCSIKSVLPVLVDKSYKGMNISNGEEASISFLKQREDAQVRKDLLKYCELDTEAMLLIVKELEKLTK